MASTAGGLRIEGLRETVARLQSMGADVADLKKVFGDIANEGARLAASFAPHRTGKLAASIKGNRAKNYASVKAGGARVPYAAVQNYGWERRDIVASRFMQRADAVLRPRVGGMLQTAIDRLIAEKGLK